MSIDFSPLVIPDTAKKSLILLLFMLGLRSVSAQATFSEPEQGVFSENVFQSQAEPQETPGNPGNEDDPPPTPVDESLWLLMIAAVFIIGYTARQLSSTEQ